MDEMEVDDQQKSPIQGTKASGETDVGFLAEANLPKGKAKEDERFRYGNYNQYYGTRLDGKFVKDPRLDLMKDEWFAKKAVLDIGCNAGMITLYIAKHMNPRRIVGLDIDPNLVGIARKNIRHYCDKDVKLAGKMPAPKHFEEDEVPTFPHNVWFICTSYVFPDEEMLDMVIPEYNTILALSITKWIHLNWGDSGLKLFFKRAYKNLKSGGWFILEPQDIRTYGKSCRKIPSMKSVYKSIELTPDKFSDYLINEVGFVECLDLGIPKAKSKGFQRPILAFRKK
ncbi:unnamed protein product [Bursaphelenchus xylophilus]|uniref:RNA methyltransferase n=1 Tax=Bursaphelenchus xylophilus TaxID=6326 RepID=A0A1I7SL64_BURXY|nr:unnamed protein product [Bursaphelenchus xylophilus]CAG9129383.1 unnamed protein product [Bursaphelenchus xylophilus]